MIRVNSPDLLIIDPLFWLFEVQDNNSSAEILPLVKQLNKIALKSSCAIVVTHHAKKADGEDFTDSALGSTALAGTFETMITIKRDENEESNRGTIQSIGRGGENFAESIIEYD